MFEPHDKETIWSNTTRLQRNGIEDEDTLEYIPIRKQHVYIYMLVETRYPITYNYNYTYAEQEASELVALRNFARRSGSRFDIHGGCIKVPMLKPCEFKLWRMRIKQYIQMIDYALWKVIENGPTLTKTVVVEGVEKVKPITSAKDKAQRRLEVKAGSTLMMGIPNEHQLKFNFVKDAKKLLEAVKKKFGGNAATKKTQRNLLKQLQKLVSQLELFDEKLSQVDVNQKLLRSLSPEWNTHVVVLQKLVSQLELLDEKLSQEDVNQKLLRSLSPEWNTHAVVWRNKADLDTMSMDAVICLFFASQPNSPQLAHEDLQQIHHDDIKEMDLR
ncbi:hypothetical protein Tco_0439491 [Tanacetum coccineum]